MTFVLALLLSAPLGGFNAASIEGVARTIAQQAASDPRFDVVSELDVRDAVDFEAARSICGGEEAACGSMLANLHDARLVLFSRAYSADGELFLALTLTDVKDSVVLYRGDVGTTETELLATAKTETLNALSSFRSSLLVGQTPTRLLVTRVAFDNDDLKRAQLARALSEAQARETEAATWHVVSTAGLAVAGGVALASFVAVEATMPDTQLKELQDLRATLGLELVPSAVALALSGSAAFGLALVTELLESDREARTIERESLEAALGELTPDTQTDLASRP